MGFRERHQIPNVGVGVGARSQHLGEILSAKPVMDWFEIISEHFMVDGGQPQAQLSELCANYRVIPHGVSLGVGSTDPCTADYLERLTRLLDALDPPWFSDHLAWGRADGMELHDLLPLPMTRAVGAQVVDRIRQVQDRFGRPFAVENISSYLSYRESEMPEWEFLSLIVEQADCGLLLDVNSVYVNAYNHGFDAQTYIDSLPHERVVQLHLAGHSDKGTHLLDSHGAKVCDTVWELYRYVLQQTGPIATSIEWDEDIPPWETLAAEAATARAQCAAFIPQKRVECTV